VLPASNHQQDPSAIQVTFKASKVHHNHLRHLYVSRAIFKALKAHNHHKDQSEIPRHSIRLPVLQAWSPVFQHHFENPAKPNVFQVFQEENPARWKASMLQPDSPYQQPHYETPATFSLSKDLVVNLLKAHSEIHLA